jgi:hypothetical protein
MAVCHSRQCNARYDPRVDHNGLPHPGGWPRLYCSEECRYDENLARARDARRANRLRILEQTEPPLPHMPTHPLLEEHPA